MKKQKCQKMQKKWGFSFYLLQLNHPYKKNVLVICLHQITNRFFVFLLLFWHFCFFYNLKIKEINNIIILKNILKMTLNMPSHTIYNVSNYAGADQNFIQTKGLELPTIELENLLSNVKLNYHFRIHPKTTYVLFGDLDNYEDSINCFISHLQYFLKQKYNLDFTNDEFKYTQNDKKTNSYHYSIPKWNASTEKLREIFTSFHKYMKDIDSKYSKTIDTTIYAEHWFRCPNQYKGSGEKNDKHVIVTGNMIDFIVDFIPLESVNIDNVCEIVSVIQKKIKPTKLAINIDISEKQNDNILALNKLSSDVVLLDDSNKQIDKKKEYGEQEIIMSNILSKPNTCKKIFDDCYKQERFDEYNNWVSVGMAIRNAFTDEQVAIDLFNYFSSKGKNYEGYEKTKCKYATFVQRHNTDGYTIATIYYFAIEDNKTKFIEIMNKNTFVLDQIDICKFLKIVAGYKFIYKQLSEENYKLYCYNGNYWQKDKIILRKYISTELYDFLKTLLLEVYWNTREFNLIKSKIEKLKLLNYRKEIIEVYKEYGLNDNVEFDNKWWLLGFNNMVYDMQTCEMRNYVYDDYVSITTGYNWREPTTEEMDTMYKLIESIMPIEAERETYLQILSTGLEGRCLEKFVLHNGIGRNGKGTINDMLLLALGDYAMIGNNGILFESSKTGSNPEKSNLHRKRFVVFREPPEKHKFENSIIKELTGGGTFSARGLYESNAIKALTLTMVVECNKRPLFSEEPGHAEAMRIIDILFRSTFVTDESMIDHENYVFKADSNVKSPEFQEKHKFALLKILMITHAKCKHLDRNNIILPESIINRSKAYLEMSCDIVEWFKDNYDETEKTEFIQVNDMFETFRLSEFHSNLSKADRKKYTKKYIKEYVETNLFFKKYYVERYKNIRHVIRGWKLKVDG